MVIIIFILLITGTPRQEDRRSFDFHGHKSWYKFHGCSFNYLQEMQVFAGEEIKNKRNIYRNMRARLQSRGTLPANRGIKHLAVKEKRLMKDVKHYVSKAIIDLQLKMVFP
jgi:hypothetical protein